MRELRRQFKILTLLLLCLSFSNHAICETKPSPAANEAESLVPSTGELIRVTEVRDGGARIIKPGGAKFRVRGGTGIVLQDILQTNSIGKAFLLLTDGTQVIVGRKTKVKFSKVQKENRQWKLYLSLKHGQIRIIRPKKPARDMKILLQSAVAQIFDGEGDYALTVVKKTNSNFLMVQSGKVKWKHRFITDTQTLKSSEYGVLEAKSLENERAKSWDLEDDRLSALKRIFTHETKSFDSEINSILAQNAKGYQASENGQNTDDPNSKSPSLGSSVGAQPTPTNIAGQPINSDQQNSDSSSPDNSQNSINPTLDANLQTDAPGDFDDESQLEDFSNIESGLITQKPTATNEFSADGAKLFSNEDRNRIAVEECGKKGAYYQANEGYCNSLNSVAESSAKRAPACVNVGGSDGDCLDKFNHDQFQKQDPVAFRCENDPTFRGQNLEACRSAQVEADQDTDQLDVGPSGIGYKKKKDAN